MNLINFHWMLVVSIILLLLPILNKKPRSTWTDDSFPVDADLNDGSEWDDFDE